ncbi:lipopolysaccharide heptosyltransferase I [Candidatus Methylospira mobilis]|uniref:Lipopolysaccharide heptosyltransferase 1 n=1 Tax=Candidatus Methylospira mobilis TaxID=1808979 RepID=A0A5Q0BIK9_9GAMM|nr:lipopolysaccharide heptosyltransferase I [Candidatus Methylospira mobilis]QFY41994.1 lipopolysaccharide heptosyltransferase I [Candidatus Methylospira mobilis]WNV02986.1 lipopolysaccharide heptosyltransferase I [Candidatus Methylospira mobilis]
MRILIIKMTSLGDIVHMLPALTDAAARLPGLSVDWVVEENFAAIPELHPAVGRIIPIALRRWRKTPLSASVRREIGSFAASLRKEPYDLIIDSQGLIKSAAVGMLARGVRSGYSFASVREPFSSLFLQKRFSVEKNIAAILRNRLLMAGAIGYQIADDAPLNYGIGSVFATAPADFLPARYLLALHGTARREKEYPLADWKVLIERCSKAGWPVALPWGNAREKQRAEQLAAYGGTVLPTMGLRQLATIVASCQGVVGVDTGLMHLAAALRKPGIGLYPSTAISRFGVLCEPDGPLIANYCETSDLEPERVSESLLALLEPAFPRTAIADK